MKLIKKSLFIIFTVSFFHNLQSEEKLPNFVVILTDDQGWNATSAKVDDSISESGSKYYRTPNLDRLMKEGMCFSRAYSSSPTCGPSRQSIQFGRSPISLRIFASPRWGVTDFQGKKSESLANLIKKVSPKYVTGHFGKWHIPLSEKEMGYDETDNGGGNGEGNSKDPDDPKLIFSLTKKGNKFMEEQVGKGRPFFLQISHYANHLKYQALSKTVKKYETQYKDSATKYQKSPLWAAMNENLDTGVGLTLDKIKELGIEDNTYVFFTSDNGYEGKFSQKDEVNNRVFHKAYPLVSHKYTINEGGLRVPFIVRGPKIPKGIKSKTRVIGHDILPTILDILGHKEQVPASVEGGSLWDLLKSDGKKKVLRSKPYFVFRYTRDARDICIIQEDFKLLKELKSGRMHLWNLESDPGEQTNLINQFPEKAERMYALMTDYLKNHQWDESMSKEDNRQSKRKANRKQN